MFIYTNDIENEKAIALATHLGVELRADLSGVAEDGVYLCCDDEGVTLTDGNLSLRGDFTEMLPRLKQANLEREFLVKASRIKGVDHPILVDATAGMGEDSIILAAAGFEVYLFEYDPVIAALLQDALDRAKDVPELAATVSRMHFTEGNSIEKMSELGIVPDVVLLDPMFPARQKSALVKRKFQLLQQLEKPCTDEEELLSAAINMKPRKIVIKRPIKGPVLAGAKPSHSLSGKAIRYDCIVIPR